MKSKRYIGLASLGLFLVSSASYAQGSASTAQAAQPPAQEPLTAYRGVQIGLRVALDVPGGDLVTNLPMSDALGVGMSLALDVGSKLTDHLYLGGYLEGFLGSEGNLFKDQCDAIDDRVRESSSTGSSESACSRVGYGLGALATYDFLPTKTFSPWVGAGIGWQKQTFDLVFADGSFSGIHFPLMAGVNFRARGDNSVMGVGIGPYIAYDMGKYSSAEMTIQDIHMTANDSDIKMHHWLQFGIKITLGI